MPVDGTGGLEFALRTLSSSSPGGYFVTANNGSSASSFFQLVDGANQWPPQGTDPTIEVPDTIPPASSVHLPLIMRQYPAPDPIVNGDFEDGDDVGWEEWSLFGWGIVGTAPDEYHPPHSGDWLAWLGGAANEIAYIKQAAAVPSGRSYLHYWHWRESSTSNCTLDRALLFINGTPVRTYDLCIATNTGGWREVAVDLSAFAEQSTLIRFQIETDWPASNWYVDDVSFQTSAATADAEVPDFTEPGFPLARKSKPAPDAP